MAKKQQPEHNDDVEPYLKDATLKDFVDANIYKYMVVALISKRAMELKNGARRLVDLPPPHTHIELALAEASAGLLKIQKRESRREMVSLVD